MKIFGNVMFSVLLRCMTLFSETVFVLKWLNQIEWSWFWTLMPTFIVLGMSVAMTLIIEATKTLFDLGTKKATDELKQATEKYEAVKKIVERRNIV